jgi:mannose-6-phosphate isomerase-like protein (cupin superfamily)
MKRQILLCLFTSLLAAQALAPEVELSAEPHHHLTLENKYVRVYNVEVPPHSETLMHHHRHDYFAVNLGAAEVVNAVKDKPPVTIKLQDGQITFAAGAFAHIVSNQTDQPFRNVTIEIVTDESLRNAAARGEVHWDEDRALETFPGGTQQILFVKDAIRASEFELQPGAVVVPMRHHAGPQLLIAVSDLDIPSEVQSDVPGVQGPKSAHFKPGDSRWLPANYSHTITNMGTKPAKFVTLEFP